MFFSLLILCLQLWRSVICANVIPINQRLYDEDICGFQSEQLRFTYKLNGTSEAKPDEFPWMALLKYRFKTNETDAGFKCTGTLINKRHILTAAHCLNNNTDVELVSVRLGEYNIEDDSNCTIESNTLTCNSSTDFGVEKVMYHIYYNNITLDNDIGLIRLSEEVVYNDVIRPICLTSVNLRGSCKYRKMLFLSGWGVTDDGPTSSVKVKTELPLVKNPKCAELLNDTSLRISANQMCAGGDSRNNVCQGDSGGPLMDLHVNEFSGRLRWYQKGVVSRGHKCGEEMVIGVYTRISRYLRWIHFNVKV